MQSAATVLGSEDWGKAPHEGNSREEPGEKHQGKRCGTIRRTRFVRRSRIHTHTVSAAYAIPVSVNGSRRVRIARYGGGRRPHEQR